MYPDGSRSLSLHISSIHSQPPLLHTKPPFDVCFSFLLRSSEFNPWNQNFLLESVRPKRGYTLMARFPESLCYPGS